MEMGIQPDYLLGYSFGEITASVISGSISLEEGFQFVVDFAVLIDRETPPAGMLAVIDSENIIDQHPDLFLNCWLTGRNFQSNFVVCGLLDNIQKLQKSLNQRNILCQRLPVNYGFHTPLIDPIEDKFKELVQKINLSPIRIPTISSSKAERISEVNEDYFWHIIRQHVEFEKTIRFMLKKEGAIFLDVGPSGSLATFVKYLLPSNSNFYKFEVINQYGKNLSSLEKLRADIVGLIETENPTTGN